MSNLDFDAVRAAFDEKEAKGEESWLAARQIRTWIESAALPADADKEQRVRLYMAVKVEREPFRGILCRSIFFTPLFSRACFRGSIFACLFSRSIFAGMF